MTNIAVLEEVERGEKHAKAVYDRALQAELPPKVRKLVQRQYHTLLKNHDRVPDLHLRYRAAA